MNAVQTSISLEQLRWQCRRGMLELDLLLNDYLDENFKRLDLGELKVLSTMLEYPDQVLLDLLLGNMQASDDDMARFINGIRESRRVP